MLFKRKNNEEKILNEIKKKKEQIDKLKEEIIKMGKLVLKDGKLTKVEDMKKEEAATVSSSIDYTNSNMDDMLQMRKQAQVLPVEPKQVPTPLSQEDYQRIQRRQQEMAAFEQQYREEQVEAERQRQLEAYQQAQLRQQPQSYQQPIQQMPVVGVTIEMITGNLLSIEVPGEKVESFIEALNLAIDNQSSFPINNKVINGRNVVSYTLE